MGQRGKDRRKMKILLVVPDVVVPMTTAKTHSKGFATKQSQSIYNFKHDLIPNTPACSPYKQPASNTVQLLRHIRTSQ